MAVFISLLIIFTGLLALILGLGLGIAFLLHWLLPAVGMEMALLIAVLAVGQALIILFRFLDALPPAMADLAAEGEPSIVILDREVTLPRRQRRKRT